MTLRQYEDEYLRLCGAHYWFKGSLLGHEMLRVITAARHLVYGQPGYLKEVK
jgi:hypothetical protein